MAQPTNLAVAALTNAGITRGNNDPRGVVGRVSGGSGRAGSSSAGMEVDRDGPGGGRPGRNKKVRLCSLSWWMRRARLGSAQACRQGGMEPLSTADKDTERSEAYSGARLP